ncbi:MAG: cytidine deaminase [Nitrospirae bacterium]|nr:cytidine deaminase [Nitrospirota bacterium]
MTTKDIELLINSAETAMENAIAPYSGFKVGASLMTKTKRLYSGSNIENPSVMLSTCAERIALMKALTSKKDTLKAIAIVSSDGAYCFPCGACRQMLFEFAPDISIYLKSKEGIKRFSIQELLPNPFIRGRLNMEAR